MEGTGQTKKSHLPARVRDWSSHKLPIFIFMYVLLRQSMLTLQHNGFGKLTTINDKTEIHLLYLQSSLPPSFSTPHPTPHFLCPLNLYHASATQNLFLCLLLANITKAHRNLFLHQKRRRMMH